MLSAVSPSNCSTKSIRRTLPWSNSANISRTARARFFSSFSSSCIVILSVPSQQYRLILRCRYGIMDVVPTCRERSIAIVEMAADRIAISASLLQPPRHHREADANRLEPRRQLQEREVVNADEVIPLVFDPHVGERIVDAVRVRHVEREELRVAECIGHFGISLLEIPIDIEYVLPLRCHVRDAYFTIGHGDQSTAI